MPTLRQRGAARSGRVVVAQVALVALLLAALGRDPRGWLVAVPVAAALVALGLVRWRRRWLAAWLADGLRYLTRARTLPGGADPGALLAFVDPTAGFGEAPGVIEDSDGVVAVVELDDGGPEGAAWPALPPLGELLATGCDAVTLIVSAVPPGGAGLVGASYRQLADGRVPARSRALLALRVSRVDVAWSGDDLRRTLAGSLRRVSRRLRQERITHHQLTAEATRATIAELAPRQATAPGQAAAPTRESWSAVRLGGLHQTGLRVPRLDRLPAEVAEQLIARLLALPAASTTIGLCACSAGTDLVVRVAAGTGAGLAGVVGAAYRLLHTAGSVPERLGGRQREGLAATLPLARPHGTGGGRAGGVPGHGAAGAERGRGAAGAGGAVRVGLAPSGLMLGRNRYHQPVTVRLFRPEPTRAVLLGGVRVAQLLALRALALHAHVTVQTTRPGAWEPFLRAVMPQTAAVTVAPPGYPAPPAPAGPLVPQLIVLDMGRAPAPAVPPAAWRACLVVREEVSTADTTALARADLVVLQPMPPDEAALVAGALGLDGSREWLSRIRADMVGAVSRLGAGRSAVRWALLSATDVERQVIGGPERVAIG